MLKVAKYQIENLSLEKYLKTCKILESTLDNNKTQIDICYFLHPRNNKTY